MFLRDVRIRPGAQSRDQRLTRVTCEIAPEQGLEALRTKPANVNQWDGPYLKKEIPLDPWGHPYLYRFPGEHGDEPDLISYGADGQAGGDGMNADIVSWKN